MKTIPIPILHVGKPTYEKMSQIDEVERDAYIPFDKQVDAMTVAGERLSAYNRLLYHYHDDNRIDEVFLPILDRHSTLAEVSEANRKLVEKIRQSAYSNASLERRKQARIEAQRRADGSVSDNGDIKRSDKKRQHERKDPPEPRTSDQGRS